MTEKIIWEKRFTGELNATYKGFLGCIRTHKETDRWITNGAPKTETFHQLLVFKEGKIVFSRTYSKNLREVKKSFLEEVEKLNNN